MTKNRFATYVLILLCVLGFYENCVQIHAESANIQLELSEEEIRVGDTFYVLVAMESSTGIGDVELTLSYDKELAKFTTGGKVAEAFDSQVYITDIGSGEARETKKYAIGFKARKKGSFTVNVEPPFAVHSGEDDGKEMSLSVSPVTVSILGKKEIADTPVPTMEVKEELPEPTLEDTKETPSNEEKTTLDKIQTEDNLIDTKEPVKESMEPETEVTQKEGKNGGNQLSKGVTIALVSIVSIMVIATGFLVYLLIWKRR